MIEKFKNKLKNDLNIYLTDDQLNKLDIYYQILVEENKKYNLTSIIEKEDIYWKHFYDSLTILKNINLNEKNILDIGSGAGFPGMVLAIVIPSSKFVLIDSNNKKTFFLNLIVNNLNLNNVLVINDRCESLVSLYKEKFDIVISRAVARLNILIELASQFLKINGSFIAYKSIRYIEEINELNQQEKKLGFNLVNIIDCSNEIIGPRYLLNYLKFNKTPNIYPRDYAKIKKKPLS